MPNEILESLPIFFFCYGREKISCATFPRVSSDLRRSRLLDVPSVRGIVSLSRLHSTPFALVSVLAINKWTRANRKMTLASLAI